MGKYIMHKNLPYALKYKAITRPMTEFAAVELTALLSNQPPLSKPHIQYA